MRGQFQPPDQILVKRDKETLPGAVPLMDASGVARPY